MNLRFAFLGHRWPEAIVTIEFKSFPSIAPKTFNYLALKPFEFERT